MVKVQDFLIRIKNAARAQRREIILPFSKLGKEMGKVLVSEGFLEEVKEEAKGNKKFLKLRVAYDRRTPRFIDATLISKPTLKNYISAKEIFEFERKGKRTLIISTSNGVMTGKDAAKKGLGGEALFAIW